jgi:ATP adenylyltransferase
MSDKFVDPNNTTHRPDGGTYGNVIQQIQKDGVCPFCPEQLLKYHKNPILKDGKYWLITENMYPYKGAVHHFLIIHKIHISHMNEISPEAQHELFEINNWLFETYKILGGTFVMRFGDSKYTGASVTHLHAHIIVSDGSQNREPILARVG